MGLQTRLKLRDKPCRIAALCGNPGSRVFRICSSATCACRPPTITNRSTSSATPCSPPGWTSATCTKTKASGARDDRPGLKACLDDLRQGDVLVVWKLDRLGRSLPHLLAIVTDLKRRGVAFRSLTEQMDTTTPHGELLFGIFGSLAQYERALTRERVVAGLAAAKRRGRHGGRPAAIDPERVEQIVSALEGGASKASVCRSFKVPRSTLLDTLARIGWTGPAGPTRSVGDTAVVRSKKNTAANAA